MSENDKTTSGFMIYPTNYLFGIVNDPSTAETTLTALSGAGFEDDSLKAFVGESGAASIDASGKYHGFLARFVRRIQHMSPDHDHAVVYEEAALEGKTVIGVHIDSEDEKAKAQEILHANGAHFVNFYGRFAVELVEGSSLSPSDKESWP